MKEGKIYDIATTHSKEDIIAHFLNPHYAMSQGWINCKLRKVRIIITVIELDKEESQKDSMIRFAKYAKNYKSSGNVEKAYESFMIKELDTCKTCNKYDTCKICVPPNSLICNLYKRYEKN